MQAGQNCPVFQSAAFDSKSIRDISPRLIEQHMTIRSIHVKVIASAIDDTELISQAILNLLHQDAELMITRGKSYHGAIQTTIEGSVKRRKDVKQVLENFPGSFYGDLIDNGLGKRIDDSKYLHFRLDLQEFVKGNTVLVRGNGRRHPVKVRMKIESYPGQDPLTEAKKFLSGLVS